MKLYTLNNITLGIGQSEDELVARAKKELGRAPAYFRITKKSLDARKKSDIKYVYSIEFSAIEPTPSVALPKIDGKKLPSDPIVIVGSGPCGLFCAVRLIEYGFTPIVIERGDSVDMREKKCNRFFEGGALDKSSNVQFGEGGAGTFSDGKLNTQTHSPLNRQVLDYFIKFGAPKEIAYLSKPHIGSDNLKRVVKNMREFIISGGGRVLFNTCLTDMDLSQGEVKAITVSAEGKSEKINVSGVILAIGHSARDTFYMLRGKGVKISAKNFAVGARIEHLQQKIGEAQYGSEYKRLPPADYKLVSHAGDRAAFTFCMCPGGYVMPATSEEGAVVTNGMSNYARDHVNANSALIVAVDKSDFASDDQLAGIEYQRMLERRAFLLGGENYCAPAQRVADFMAGKKTSAWGEVLPSYRRGVSFADLGEALPESIAQNMRLAIRDMDKRLRGFMSGDAVLTGVETRTSSPVRIERGEDMQSVSVQNLYPCGEGAGYAGGITSSAADGLRVADVIMRKYDV